MTTLNICHGKLLFHTPGLLPAARSVEIIRNCDGTLLDKSIDFYGTREIDERAREQNVDTDELLHQVDFHNT